MTCLFRIKTAVAAVLGNVCARCGCLGHWSRQSEDERIGRPLQVGHPNGRRWSIRRVNTTTRWMHYLREALRGRVQAECGLCNRKHGGGLRYSKVDKTRQGKRRS